MLWESGQGAGHSSGIIIAVAVVAEAFKEEGSQWQYDGIYVDKRKFAFQDVYYLKRDIDINDLTLQDGGEKRITLNQLKKQNLIT